MDESVCNMIDRSCAESLHETSRAVYSGFSFEDQKSYSFRITSVAKDFRDI